MHNVHPGFNVFLFELNITLQQIVQSVYNSVGIKPLHHTAIGNSWLHIWNYWHHENVKPCPKTIQTLYIKMFKVGFSHKINLEVKSSVEVFNQCALNIAGG